MSCQKHFLNMQWEHHRWRKQVASFETVTIPETNIWCRVVNRHYVRCDKQSVCEICGATARQSSCFCDVEVAERCKLRNACIARSESV